MQLIARDELTLPTIPMANTHHRFEVEIRDTNRHESHSMADEAGATVLTDELNPNDLQRYDSIRLYIDDDHDQGFDVTVEHTHTGDESFTAAVETAGSPLTLAAGQDSATLTIDGPIGQLQFATETGGLASAPTSGSLLVELVASN